MSLLASAVNGESLYLRIVSHRRIKLVSADFKLNTPVVVKIGVIKIIDNILG